MNRDQTWGDLPNLLFDSVTFGVEAVVGGIAPEEFDALVAALRSACPPAARGRTGPVRGGTRISASVPLPGVDATVEAELVWLRLNGGAHLSPASWIRVNPLTLLAVAGEGDGASALDGRLNHIGPHPDDARDLLACQLALVVEAVEAVAGMIGAAFPDGTQVVREALWVRSAEVCRDLAVADAVGHMRRLQRTFLQGSVVRSADAYRRGALDEGGVPTVRWWRTRTGPTLKAYAKRPEMVRAEVSCPNRDAVAVAQGGRPVAEFDGPQAAGLLSDLGAILEPFLDEVAGHVLGGVRDAARPVEALATLLPLVLLATGHREGRGAPPDPASVRHAGDALDALVASGACSLTGLPKGGAARRVLERLAEPGGPLVRQGRRAVYVLRQDLAAAFG